MGSFFMWSALPKTRNALLSFWYRTPHKKRLHLFLVLNAVTDILKLRAREKTLSRFKKTSAIV
jgi:hypothetical protein